MSLLKLPRSSPSYARYTLVAVPATLGLVTVLVAGAPPLGPSLILLVLVATLTMALVRSLGERELHDERTLLTLLESIRKGNVAIRASMQKGGQPYHRILEEVNLLATALQQRQLAEHEAQNLVRKTLAVLDAGVYLFDHDQCLKMTNLAGANILRSTEKNLIGRSASDLSLAALFDVTSGSVQSLDFGGSSGRWHVRHATLRIRARPARLLVIQSVEPILRKQQAESFTQLLRVISHEINNTLAPISSMAATAQQLLPASAQFTDADLLADIRESLVIIERRSTHLRAFISQYAVLAKIPAPCIQETSLRTVMESSLAIFRDIDVTVNGADISVAADRVQLEQVLINILRNGTQSAGATQLLVSWNVSSDNVMIEIADNGAGITNRDNLFTPFYTTKKYGNGIGLALARQIMDAHGGRIDLDNRVGARGAVARLELPLFEVAASTLDRNTNGCEVVQGN